LQVGGIGPWFGVHRTPRRCESPVELIRLKQRIRFGINTLHHRASRQPRSWS